MHHATIQMLQLMIPEHMFQRTIRRKRESGSRRALTECHTGESEGGSPRFLWQLADDATERSNCKVFWNLHPFLPASTMPQLSSSSTSASTSFPASLSAM